MFSETRKQKMDRHPLFTLALRTSSRGTPIAASKALPVCALVIFLLTSPTAWAQKLSATDLRWAVNVEDEGPHPTYKKLNCHPLQYFVDPKNLKEFDYGAFQLRDLLEDNVDKVHSYRLGAIRGFTIYEAIHRVGDDEGFRILKMILVERKSGQFCEIYHEQGESGILIVESSFIVDVGGEKVLASHDRVPGTGNFYNEAYWTFDKDGPIPLDLNVIDEAVDSVIPAGMGLSKGGGFDVTWMSFDSGIWKDGDGGCCPSGEVHLKLALKNHKLVVISKRFELDN
jgi:hypothetical protein